MLITGVAPEGNLFYFDWEPTFMIWLQNVLGPFAEKVCPILSMLGEEYVMIAVFAVFYLWLNKEAGRYIGTNFVTCLCWNPFIKNIFLRVRPYLADEGIKCLKPVDESAPLNDMAAQGYSFPSGHSCNAATMYGSVAAFFRRWWLWLLAAVLILLVGFSRVAVGVHYPTDVLTGWALGFLLILVVSLLQKHIKKRWLLFLILTVPLIPGWFFCASNDFFTGFGIQVGFFCGMLFDDKYVRFKNTRNVLYGILRVLGGMAIYLGLSNILKLPFPHEMREANDFLAHLIRAGRYAVTTFTVSGVYPMLFNVIDKRLEKWKAARTPEVTSEDVQDDKGLDKKDTSAEDTKQV